MLAPTRWKLRRAVRIVNETLEALGLVKHPNKTFIGRVERGFDFLGYPFTPQGLRIAPACAERLLMKAHRLYEQERAGRKPPGALGAYTQHWLRWAGAGLAPRDSAARKPRSNSSGRCLQR